MVRFWGACRSLGVDGNRRTGTAVSTVCLVGRLVVKTRMRTLLVVERDPFSDADLGFASGLERMQIDGLVFQRPPQPLDHDVVHPPPLAVHRDPDAGFLEHLGELQGGELAPLVRVEDPGRPEPGQRLPKGRHAKIRLQRVRQPPGKDFAAVPVHDRHEIEKPPTHRDVADVRAPDLVRLVDRHPLQQVRVDLVTGTRLCGRGFLVDRRKPHLPHQPGDPLAADAPSPPTEPAGHLPGSEEGGLQELPVDDPHEIEVERGFSDRLVVERGAADSQKKALPGDREPGMGRLHHPFPPVSAARPKALDKKSRSTGSSAIATLALNSAEYRFRLFLFILGSPPPTIVFPPYTIVRISGTTSRFLFTRGRPSWASLWLSSAVVRG